MTIQVKNPDTMFVQKAYELYNVLRRGDLPTGAGKYRIDDTAWSALIDVTRQRLGEVLPGQVPRESKGLCIWASVIAAKYFVLRNHIFDARVVRVQGKGDHYFVVAQFGGPAIICDLTCDQFGGPNYMVGTLAELKPTARQVLALGSNLYDIYKLGTKAQEFVV